MGKTHKIKEGEQYVKVVMVMAHLFFKEKFPTA
jgi:hypothetical protein